MSRWSEYKVCQYCGRIQLTKMEIKFLEFLLSNGPQFAKDMTHLTNKRKETSGNLLASATLQRLTEQGLCEQKKVKTGARGAPKSIYTITDLAKNLMEVHLK